MKTSTVAVIIPVKINLPNSGISLLWAEKQVLTLVTCLQILIIVFIVVITIGCFLHLIKHLTSFAGA